MLTIKPLENGIWDEFIEETKQGSIFHTTKWCSLFPDKYRVYGVKKGSELVGGIIGFEQVGKYISGGYTLTPYQGIVVKSNGLKYVSEMSLHTEIGLLLAEFLSRTYESVSIVNHWTFPDIRPFLWHGWRPILKYTYVVDISDMEMAEISLEKDTRYAIKQAKDMSTCTVKDFGELYDFTFHRKGLESAIVILWLNGFFNTIPHELVACGDSAGVMMWDSKRAYFIFAGSKCDGGSNGVLWNLLKDMNKLGYDEVDLVGCNDQMIGAYKRGFGGTLTPYLGATNV